LLMFGVSAPMVLAIGVALAIVGAWRLSLRDADFVGYVALLITGSATAIVLMRPAWIQHPGVLSRYMLPALPFALLFIAEGAVTLAKRLRPAFTMPLAI